MARKAKKIVPKRIGTVKIPKRLRKTVNKALSNPRTAEMASGALLAIGTALARKTLGEKAAKFGFASSEDAKPQAAGQAKPAEAVADIGALVAGAAGEAVRGVAGAVTRIVEEAADTLRREFGHRTAAGQGTGSEAGPADTEAGAQSEPAAPGESPSASSGRAGEPETRFDGSESFGDRDDNDDPTDGNDRSKPGPMTGAGP